MKIVSRLKAVLLIIAAAMLWSSTAMADFAAAEFKLLISETAQNDRDIAEFYEESEYTPLWAGRSREVRERRAAFFEFLSTFEFHGLPSTQSEAQKLSNLIRHARTQSELAIAEIETTKAYLKYAQMMQTGLLKPGEIDDHIVRKVPYRDRKSYLTALAQSTPSAFFRALPPSSLEYSRLVAERQRLLRSIAQGGWGDAIEAGGLLEMGSSGSRVIALRNRLIALGYLENTYSERFDEALRDAVFNFQANNGLKADGIAGPSTISMINMSPESRLKSVVVAMERERWTNMDLGDRHVLVNLADFHVKIMDKGRVTFETRSVVGHPEEDRRSPEFSDEIEYMIVNPTWHVPRSIATKEYLPLLQEDRFALDYLNLFDAEGEIVERFGLDFTEFTEEDFPFDMKQAPSTSNALGLVKYMFPNRYNIYLHDTPAKSLFAEESRAFSHGCIRLGDPFDFGYALLALQTNDPEGVFHEALETGEETQIDLEQHVPIHIMYRTAVGSADGNMGYRRDVYGRDAQIWSALESAGVELGV